MTLPFGVLLESIRYADWPIAKILSVHGFNGCIGGLKAGEINEGISLGVTSLWVSHNLKEMKRKHFNWYSFETKEVEYFKWINTGKALYPLHDSYSFRDKLLQKLWIHITIRSRHKCFRSDITRVYKNVFYCNPHLSVEEFK